MTVYLTQKNKIQRNLRIILLHVQLCDRSSNICKVLGNEKICLNETLTFICSLFHQGHPTYAFFDVLDDPHTIKGTNIAGKESLNKLGLILQKIGKWNFNGKHEELPRLSATSVKYLFWRQESFRYPTGTETTQYPPVLSQLFDLITTTANEISCSTNKPPAINTTVSVVDSANKEDTQQHLHHPRRLKMRDWLLVWYYRMFNPSIMGHKTM